MEQKSGSENPLGVAIIVCEKVITEVGTNNKTIVSTFNSVQSRNFPSVQPRLAVFVALTNATGQKQIELIFSKDQKQLFKIGGPVPFSNPNAVVELIFNINNLLLPETGIYCFEVLADGEFIFESRFNVVLDKQS